MIPPMRGKWPVFGYPKNPNLLRFSTWHCCAKATFQWKTDIFWISWSSGSRYTNQNKAIACYNIVAGGCFTLAPSRQKVCWKTVSQPKYRRTEQYSAPLLILFNKHTA